MLREIFRAIKNILIALGSIGWILPFQGSVAAFLHWFYHSQNPNYQLLGGDFNFHMSLFLFRLASVWLAIVIAFWAFVAANKLWPVKGKKNEKSNL